MDDKRDKSKKQLAERLRSTREKRGMTQSKLAATAGISKTSQNLYEQGERVPDAIVIKKIAEVLDVTCDYLLGLSDVPNRTTKLPDEIARLTQEQRNVLLNCDDVIIISKPELLERIGRILLE